MGTVIADITELDHPGVVWLILKVECPVLRIRQLVVDIVTAKEEGTIEIAGQPASRVAASRLLEVGQIGLEGCCRGWRRWWQSGAERLSWGRVLRDGDRLHERR